MVEGVMGLPTEKGGIMEEGETERTPLLQNMLSQSCCFQSRQEVSTSFPHSNCGAGERGWAVEGSGGQGAWRGVMAGSKGRCEAADGVFRGPEGRLSVQGMSTLWRKEKNGQIYLDCFFLDQRRSINK